MTETNNPEQKKILIVEDERPMANALQIKLRAAGFDARIASDGEEALKVLKEDHFDLILLDLIMPKLDGFGVLRALQENHNKIPIIVASNLGQMDDLNRAKELGAADYFIKSNISIADIIIKVKKALNLPQ